MAKRVIVYSSTLNFRGGAEANTGFLIKALLSLGYAIYVLTETKVKTFEYLNELYRVHPNAFTRLKWLPLKIIGKITGSRLGEQRVIDVVHRSIFAFILTPILLLFRIFELKILIRKVEPDAILLSITNINNLLLARASKKSPLIFWSQTPLKLVTKRTFWFLNRLIARAVETQNVKILANSTLMFLNLDRKLRKAKTEVLLVPFDGRVLERWRFSRKEKQSVAVVARIARHKKIHHAIDVAEHLRKRRPSETFVVRIVGDIQDHSYLAEIKKKVKMLNLGGYIEIVPDGHPSAVMSVLQRSQLLWNFSEGYGSRVNIEAMACGCIPVVSPNMADDVLFDQNLVCSTIDDFVNSTADLFENTEKLASLRKQALSFVVKNHGLEPFKLKLKQVILSSEVGAK